jgi:hypothetical protein
MSPAGNRPTISALEALGSQFEALEVDDQAVPKVPSRGARAAAVLATLIGIGVSIALAPAVDAVADRVSELVTAVENPAPLRQAQPETETHLEKPAPELVQTCQERLQQSPTDELCQIVILLDRGQLAPGDYTNAELQEALDRLLNSDRLPKSSR